MSNDPWWAGTRTYLVGNVMVWRPWTRRWDNPHDDHDHCPFCWATFSDTAPGALREGFTDDPLTGDAIWICRDCFSIPELRAHFQLTCGEE